MADDSKQAGLKSGLVADPAWDFDYVMMFSRPIYEVNVKENLWKWRRDRFFPPEP